MPLSRKDTKVRGCGCGGCLTIFTVILPIMAAIANFFSWLWGIFWPVGFFVLVVIGGICLIVAAVLEERKKKPTGTKKGYDHNVTVDATSPNNETQEIEHKPVSVKPLLPLILCPNCKRMITDVSQPCSSCGDATHINNINDPRLIPDSFKNPEGEQAKAITERLIAETNKQQGV